MRKPSWLPAAALAAVTAAALAVSLYAFYLRGRDEAAIAAVVLLLLLFQLALFGLRDARRGRELADLGALAGPDAPMTQRLADLEQRLRKLEQRHSASVPAPPTEKDKLIAEVKDLRSSLRSIVAAAPEPRLELPPAREPPPLRSTAITQELLDLYLEPIVSLRTQATLHYRVSMGIETGADGPLLHDDLAAEADRTGLRAALDVFALQRTLPVARRLMAKRPEARVFVPIGLPTLTRPGYLAEIERLLRESRYVSQGLVFEIAQDVLAGLDDTGIEGLARLARQGPLLCLGAAEPEGLDLGALRGLRFRYLAFDAASPPDSVARFAGHAATQGFEVVASGVASAEELGQAEAWAMLARGPGLAPPRLVKPESAGSQSARAA